MLKPLIPNWTYLLICVVFLIGCYEKQDGCLDINASNYDFEADRSCEDCCTYPNFKIQINHIWNDSTRIDNTWYINQRGQQIKLLDFGFYWSEIGLVKEGTSFYINDRFDVINELGVESTIIEDITFVKNGRLNYTVGKFAANGTFEELRFKVGISDNYVASDDSESFIEDDTFFDEETFSHTNFRLKAIIDTLTLDTVTINLKGVNFVKEITLNGVLEIPVGTDFTIPIYANYADLLGDIDFNTLETNESMNILFNNLDFFFHY